MIANTGKTRKRVRKIRYWPEVCYGDIDEIKMRESEYTDEEVKEAMTFVIKDNHGRTWKSQDEFFEAVNNYLLENTVISNLEELIKDGMVKEISPNQFVPTEKGLKLLKELEKENKEK